MLFRSRGLEALLDAIEQLQGAPLLASVLETDILPARVHDFTPAMLDTLVAAGEVTWAGIEPNGDRDGRIALIDFGMMGNVDRDTMDELLSFLVAILLGDAEMLVTQFVELGLVDDTVNVRAMQAEISEIIRRFLGITLAQLDIGVFIGEVFETVVRYRDRKSTRLNSSHT